MTQNNLGGFGPDSGAEEIRFAGVGEKNGAAMDLVVTDLSGYDPSNVAQNRVNGLFGQACVRIPGPPIPPA